MSMSLRKGKFPLLSTEEGQVGWIGGAWFILFLSCILITVFQIRLFQAASQYLEDGLAAADLSALLINVEVYGEKDELVLDSPNMAYDRFCNALVENLNLSTDWSCLQQGILEGPVELEEFIAYEVHEDKILGYRYSQQGLVEQFSGTFGDVKAPNGMLIENSGVYAKINCPVRGFFGIELTATKEKLADLARMEE